MDPSMLIGYLIRDEKDWRSWRQAISQTQGKAVVHVAEIEPVLHGHAAERDGAVNEVETFDDDDNDGNGIGDDGDGEIVDGVGTSSVENRVWELLAQDELYIVVTQVPQLYETFLETRWLDVRNNDSVKSWVLDLLTT
ncbi:Cysteine protease atg4 [Lignoscripta atroalba]|nr:Cysteine protease atg4 [Lignoscripta atroalba]